MGGLKAWICGGAGAAAVWMAVQGGQARGEVKAAETELMRMVLGTPSAERLRAWHTLLGSEPHIAGTEGDARVIERIAGAMREMGLEVQVHEFEAYLPMPVEGKVEILHAIKRFEGEMEGGPVNEEGKFGEQWSGGREEKAGAAKEGEKEAEAVKFAAIKSVAVVERKVKEDEDAGHVMQTIGWNAYSGSGTASGEVVYANYGRKEDFQKLKELGVEVKGKVVLVRYGGNFRGYKVKFAQEAGAAGLVIYTDPKDSGYMKGQTYPEGGWANDSAIQRGSILYLDYPGDPLTPGWAAVEGARRLAEEEVDLPRIPVQPIGYGAAREIMKLMHGRSLPAEDAGMIAEWQGGLPFAYRLEGGEGLRLRVSVKQERKLRKTANVIGTLRGREHAEERVIIGCHHDAWCNGAHDPLAGTILVMEAARSFAEAAKAGQVPRRTVQFALWGAEEFGIIGSTEYCENYEEELAREGAAYINLDAAAGGVEFGASGSPTLWKVIEESTALVPQARGSAGESVLEKWRGVKKEVEVGTMGGGSDHIGFYCRLGIPSCGLSSGGAAGTAYHSRYDTLRWYRQVVGEDYEPALMLSRVTNALSARLADDEVLPIDAAGYAKGMRAQLEVIEKRAKERKAEVSLEGLRERIGQYEAACARLGEILSAGLGGDEERVRMVNAMLAGLERRWLKREGLPERPWFRNWYGASDPDSGYAAWGLPGLRWAVERGERVEEMRVEYERLVDNLRSEVESCCEKLGKAPG